MTSTATDRPWWSELGAVVPRSLAFARRAVRPEVDGVPPLSASPLAVATVAVDELAMSTAYLLSRRRAAVVSDAAVETTAEAVRRLTAAGVVTDPGLAHPTPPSSPGGIRLSRRHRAGIDFEHLSFPSAYEPPVPLPGTGEWDAGEANRRTHAYLLRPEDRRPRPWLVVLHGHRMGEPRDLRLLGSRRLQAELDVSVAHLVLPMHGPRGRGGRHPFPGVDPVANFLGLAQATWDARTLLAWIRAREATSVGVYGVSLGGHVAALLAGLDDDLAAVVAGVPTSDVATMLATTMRARWGDEAVRASHVLDEDFRTLSRIVSPLAFAPRLPLERRFIYGAVGDRLITPEQALALWRHWEEPAILWLQGGHILNNVAAARRFVVGALADSGVGQRRAG